MANLHVNRFFKFFFRQMPDISGTSADVSVSALPRGFYCVLERIGKLTLSGIAVGTAILGLWIAIWSTQEKVRLSRGVAQIMQVVNLSRELAQSYSYFGNNSREDLIAALFRVERLQDAREVDGVYALTNPWDGLLFAVTIPGQMMRVETMLPPRTCRRIVDIFAETPETLGVLRIEVRGWDQPWKTVYAAHENLAFDDDVISAACHSTARAQVSLRLKLR